jgi:hypothetical protein
MDNLGSKSNETLNTEAGWFPKEFWLLADIFHAHTFHKSWSLLKECDFICGEKPVEFFQQLVVGSVDHANHKIVRHGRIGVFIRHILAFSISRDPDKCEKHKNNDGKQANFNRLASPAISLN